MRLKVLSTIAQTWFSDPTLSYNDSDGGRISEQRLANGDVYQYEHILVKQEIVETIVSDPTGRRKFFFQRGRLTKNE